LFCIHAAGGLLNIYKTLVAHLPSDRPVYGIQSRALAGDAPEHASLQEMAEAYAAAIGRKQAAGGIHLLGFSAGGLIAMATANELERAGRTVALVGLIDSDRLWSDQQHLKTGDMQGLLVEMVGLFARELKVGQSMEESLLWEKAGDIAREFLPLPTSARVRLTVQWLKENDLFPELPETLVTRYISLFLDHFDLIAGAKHEVVRAPIVFWKAGGRAGQALGWRDLNSGNYSEHILDGGHYDLMCLPLVETLAGQLRQALDGTESTL